MDAERYPLIARRGFCVCDDEPKAPPGITSDELRRVLTDAEQQQLAQWTAGGVTMAANGMYLHDVERFLEGLPNLD